MTVSHLSSPAWHVATALILTVVAATTGGDGRAHVAQRDHATPVRNVAEGTETYRGCRLRLMPGGKGNPDIRTFHERAQAGVSYPADAYVLKNSQEFFAMTESLCLHGHLARLFGTPEA